MDRGDNIMRIAIAVVLSLLLGTAAASAGWDEGVAAYKAGRFDQAVLEFQQVVQQQPDWPGGHFMLGQSLLKLHRNQEALTQLRAAYDKSPNDLQIKLALGNAYLAVGRHGEAATLLRSIDERSLPQSHRAIYNQMLAKALQESGQSGAALAALRRAAAANPQDAEAQYSLGVAALNAGDTPTAVGALGKAASLDRQDPKKQKLYAQALILQGRQARGKAKLPIYRRAADTAKALVALQPTYDNLLLLGETHLGAKQYDEAIAAFKQASAKNAAAWYPDFYIGQAYTATGQYGAAEAALRKSLGKTRNEREKSRIWSQLGFVAEKQREFDAAIAAYRNAGDTAAADRVATNKDIAAYNAQVEQEAKEIQRLQEEQERIKKEMEALPGGPPPPA